MSRKRSRLATVNDVRDCVERHVLSLGFQQAADYFVWCGRRGFEGSFDKTRADLKREAEVFALEKRVSLNQSRLHKSPKAFFTVACFSRIDANNVIRPNMRRVFWEIQESDPAPQERRALFEMLTTLARYDKLIFGATDDNMTALVRALIQLNTHRAHWRRPLKSWRPRTRNGERQLNQLIRYLLDEYGDVPAFMDSVWLRNDRKSGRYRDWYVQLGAGTNLRKLDCPVKITKRIAHEFMRAPDDYSIEQAIRWGQLRSMGVARPTIDGVAGSRLGRSLAHEDFWITFLRFIAANPMLDPRQIGPLVDYLHNQKFALAQRPDENGEYKARAAQPGLSLHGRTPNSLLQQMETWHDRLGVWRGTTIRQFPPSLYRGFARRKGPDDNPVHWSIREIRSERDLYQEGEILNHCVASYTYACLRGSCSIWSLSRAGRGEPFKRRQTIELSNDGTIVQCRGKANRDPEADEWSIVRAWAAEAGLKIAPYMN